MHGCLLPPVTELLTTKEVAERLGVSVPTVIRRAQTGKLKVARQLPGATGAYLFDPMEIETVAS